MNHGHKPYALALGLIVLAVSFTGAIASTQLALHWDKQAGTSRAVITNSAGDVLAEAIWDGALPRSYAADEEEVETPTFLLATLRDQIQLSSAPGADAALADPTYHSTPAGWAAHCGHSELSDWLRAEEHG